MAPALFEIGNHFRDGRIALPDGAVDADDVLALLIENAVDGDGGLAGLPVAEDQLALAASHRNERVDHFGAGGQRHGNRRAIHDRGRGALDRRAQVRVDGPARRRAGGPADPPRARASFSPTGVSRTRLVRRTSLPDSIGGCVVEQNHADVAGIEIERHTQQPPSKRTSSSDLTLGRPRTRAMPCPI